jgi:NADH-quinone oxidoreductase subunit J
MIAIFYLHATIAVIAMAWAMLTPHAVHALLFAVVSLISLAVSMYSLSAELAAALEVIIYTGAIMVLFVFAIMLLKPETLISHKIKWKSGNNVFLGLMIAFFFGEILWALKDGFPGDANAARSISEIAHALFHTYGFYVEVISFVLLAGFVTTIFVARSLNRMKKAEKTT